MNVSLAPLVSLTAGIEERAKAIDSTFTYAEKHYRLHHLELETVERTTPDNNFFKPYNHRRSTARANHGTLSSRSPDNENEQKF